MGDVDAVNGPVQSPLERKAATEPSKPTVELRSAVEKIVNQRVGHLRLEQTIFPVADNPDLDMVVTMPLDEDTVTKLNRLAELRETQS